MASKRSRSPKFPSVGLEEALITLRPVFEAESRNKMSREVLASHLGYSGLSGASTSKIGALRHFGLIEGRGDELRVSDNAVVLLMRSQDSPEYRTAVELAFSSPTIYRELLSEYECAPSLQNVEFALVQRGVLKKNAAIAAQDFVNSGDFAGVWEEIPNFGPTDAGDGEFEISSEGATSPDMAESLSLAQISTVQNESALGFEEKSGGLLSKDTEYKLLVRGALGANELRRLIRKIEIDIEILLEDQ